MRKMFTQSGEAIEEVRSAVRATVKTQHAQANLLIVLTAVSVTALLVAALIVKGAARS